MLSSNKNHEHLWLVLIHVDDVYMCFRSSSNDTIWVSERKREKEKKWRKKCVFAKHRISRTEEHSAKTKSQQTIAHTHTHIKNTLTYKRKTNIPSIQSVDRYTFHLGCSNKHFGQRANVVILVSKVVFCRFSPPPRNTKHQQSYDVKKKLIACCEHIYLIVTQLNSQ